MTFTELVANWGRVHESIKNNICVDSTLSEFSLSYDPKIDSFVIFNRGENQKYLDAYTKKYAKATKDTKDTKDTTTNSNLGSNSLDEGHKGHKGYKKTARWSKC